MQSLQDQFLDANAQIEILKMEKESGASILKQEKQQFAELSEKYAEVHKQLETLKFGTGMNEKLRKITPKKPF